MVGFNIANRKIGGEAPAFIIAEIGANHNGDPILARKLVEGAAKAGVDAVKFQTYTAAELVADAGRLVTWGPKGSEKTEPIGEMFDRVTLHREAHNDLLRFAESLGLIAFSTPFSIEGVHFLDKLDVPCFKIAASDVTYLDLLEEAARPGKPVLLSLGKCTLAEADKAIETLINAGCKDLGILHCVAKYPSPMEEMNLRAIPSLASIYPQCVVGFSDHSKGLTASLGAVALGAKIIEKHFTLDKAMNGPDHWFSMDINEMRSLVSEIRALEGAMGQPGKRVVPCEKDEKLTSTRSLVLNQNVKAETIITADHIKVVRPGWGIQPGDKDKVIGLKVQCDLPSNTVLEWKYFK